MSVDDATLTAGSNQTMGTGRTFPMRFQLTIVDGSGNLLSGQPVTFTAPSSGPGGTFPGGVATATVNTDSNGVATAPPFTANNTAGSYFVGVTSHPAVTFALTNSSCINNPVVTTNANAGGGSVREAIQDACAGSTITFSGAVVSPIKLHSRLRIDDN